MRQQDAHTTNAGGAVETTCNIPPPFQGQHLRRWLHASKLTTSSNAGGAQRISGQSPLGGQVWSHLNQRLSLSQVRWWRWWPPCRHNKRYPLMNGTATQVDNCISRNSPKLCRRLTVETDLFRPPICSPLDIATKSGESHVLYHSAHFHTDRMRYLSLGKKIHIFLIGDSPRGLPSHVIHF